MKNYTSKPIDRFAFRFKNYSYRPIRLCLEDGQGLAATILLCCAIDLLAKFSSGDPKNSGNRLKYIAFLRRYFSPAYSPDVFYEFVRCGLIHSYSMEDQYTILCRNEPWACKIHLCRDAKTGKTVINPFQILTDLQTAVRNYVEDVKTSDAKAAAFRAVHKALPLKQQVARWKKLKYLAGEE
ncbi:MAG: hypothetical protein ACYC69_08775 [Thermodesulfovibrionales bacterium]